MKVWRGEGDFLDAPQGRQGRAHAFERGRARENFDLGYHLKHVDTIFKRVFGASG